MNNKYVLGLDIGITSIGWSIIDEVKGKLLDMGVHMFEQATPAQEARLNRSARRTGTTSRKRTHKIDKF